jgi:hypothetical protein
MQSLQPVSFYDPPKKLFVTGGLKSRKAAIQDIQIATKPITEAVNQLQEVVTRQQNELEQLKSMVAYLSNIISSYLPKK